MPKLAKLTRETIPFLKQARALSSCFNTVIIPWANDRVTGGPVYDASHGSEGRIFEETAYGLAGIAGESRSGDANGQYIRVIGGGGTNTVVTNDRIHRRHPAGGPDAVPDRRGDAAAQRLGEDPLQAQGALREPGGAEPRRGARRGADADVCAGRAAGLGPGRGPHQPTAPRH